MQPCMLHKPSGNAEYRQTVGVKLAEVYIDELHRARKAPDSKEKEERIASLELRLDRVSYATDVGSSLPVYGPYCSQVNEGEELILLLR